MGRDSGDESLLIQFTGASFVSPQQSCCENVKSGIWHVVPQSFKKHNCCMSSIRPEYAKRVQQVLLQQTLRRSNGNTKKNNAKGEVDGTRHLLVSYVKRNPEPTRRACAQSPTSRFSHQTIRGGNRSMYPQNSANKLQPWTMLAHSGCKTVL